MKRKARKLQPHLIDDTDAELDRSWLISILNCNGGIVSPQGSRRVGDLLNDLLALNRLQFELARQVHSERIASLDRWPRYRFERAEVEAMDREGRQLLARINHRLQRCRWCPLIFVSDLNAPADYSFDFGATTEGSYFENFAVEVLLDYLAEGKIGWFRRCTDCDSWFIATTEHQKFCSTNCRFRRYSTSAEFKRKRASYMRERYRPLMKELEQRNKPVPAKKKGR